MHSIFVAGFWKFSVASGSNSSRGLLTMSLFMRCPVLAVRAPVSRIALQILLMCRTCSVDCRCLAASLQAVTKFHSKIRDRRRLSCRGVNQSAPGCQILSSLEDVSCGGLCRQGRRTATPARFNTRRCQNTLAKACKTYLVVDVIEDVSIASVVNPTIPETQ